MFRTDSYTSHDTYARHLILTLFGREIDLSIVALEDEGCDNKMVRLMFFKRGNDLPVRVMEAGITRDHYMLIDQTFYTTPWRLRFRSR